MHKLSATLLGLSFLLSTPLAAAKTTSVPTQEPETTIIRHGRDLDWHQPENTPYDKAADQKSFQEWMAQEYNAWKEEWQEPFDREAYIAANRRVRQILTAAQREAVRTGDWSKKPLLTIGRQVIQQPMSVEKSYDRMSRRQILSKQHARMKSISSKRISGN